MTTFRYQITTLLIVFRRCLVPVSIAAIAVDSKGNPQIEEERELCRPSELPLYTPDKVCMTHDRETDSKPGKLEAAIRNVRCVLEDFNKEVDAYKRVGAEQIEKRKEDVDWLVNYLRQEDDPLPKVGAIGIGALTGLIFGLRGGFFKKTLYATTGALGMTAVCYPKEAKEYSAIGISEAKKYMIVAYNFVNGDGKSGAVAVKAEEQEQVTESQSVKVQDPLKVITRARDEAVEKQCHCPIGACLGHPDEPNNEATPPSTSPDPE